MMYSDTLSVTAYYELVTQSPGSGIVIFNHPKIETLS